MTEGLEKALCSMKKGEIASVRVPRRRRSRKGKDTEKENKEGKAVQLDDLLYVVFDVCGEIFRI